MWIGECPLSVEFNQLYMYCRIPQISVEDACGAGNVQIDFKRSLNEAEIDEWMRFVELVSQLNLVEGRDGWVLEKKGSCSTRSPYTTPGHTTDRIALSS